MLQSPDISVTSPLNLTMAFDSTDSSQRVPVSRLTGKRQSFFLHIAHIAAKTSSHFEKKRIHLPECSCVFQSVIRPSVPTNMLFDRSKEFFVETDVRDGQRNGIRAMDIGGGCDSKNSVLLSRRHCALIKLLMSRRYCPKPYTFLSCAFSSPLQALAVRRCKKSGVFVKSAVFKQRTSSFLL